MSGMINEITFVLRLLWACLLWSIQQHMTSIDQRLTDFFIDRGTENLHVLYTTQLCLGEGSKVNTARVSLVLKAIAQNAWVGLGAIYRGFDVFFFEKNCVWTYYPDLDTTVFVKKSRWLQRLPATVDDQKRTSIWTLNGWGSYHDATVFSSA